MTGRFCRLAVVCWLASFAWTAAARAGDAETRIYRVLVDGKHGGEAHFTIERDDDGTTTVACDSDIRVRVLIYTYRYNYRGREVWKDGRLRQFDSACNDDGKRFTVNAVADAEGLRVRVNGRERRVRPDVWLTSYWSLPEPKLRHGVLALLDADTGRDLDGRLQSLGEQQIAIEGRLQNARHFRLTGKVLVDLWYDAADRLVRQEWLEDGHRTVLELTGIRR
jgi:hypothetical protein